MADGQAAGLSQNQQGLARKPIALSFIPLALTPQPSVLSSGSFATRDAPLLASRDKEALLLGLTEHSIRSHLLPKTPEQALL
jgi:hypothetical protein